MNELTATLPYGKQRLLEIAVAIAAKPRVLLLDEPAAGCRKGGAATISGGRGALPADVTVLLIEHDMDLVFSFAEPDFCGWSMARCWSKAAGRGGARSARQGVYLARPPMPDLLCIEGFARRLRRSGGIAGFVVAACGEPGAGAVGPQRHRQDTLINSIVGLTNGSRKPSPWRRISRRCGRQRARAGSCWVPQSAYRPLADGSKKT